MADYTQVKHTFDPIFNAESRVLILGSFPSVKSREQQFYYGHPQNRFWKVLAAVTKEPVPETIPEKKTLLLKHGIAIWDVIDSCQIIGSSDSSIRDVVVNDFSTVLTCAPIQKIYGNGAKACDLYQKYAYPQTQREIVKLPSTSPANAAWSVERLVGEWIQVLE